MSAQANGFLDEDPSKVICCGDFVVSSSKRGLVVRHGTEEIGRISLPNITALTPDDAIANVYVGTSVGDVFQVSILNRPLRARKLEGVFDREGVKSLDEKNGELFVVGANLKRVGLESLEVVAEFGCLGLNRGVVVSPTMNEILLFGRKGMKEISFEGGRFKVKREITAEPIKSAAYSDSGKILVAGSAKGELIVVANDSENRVKGHVGRVMGVVFGNDYFISAGEDSRIRFWKFKNGDFLKKPELAREILGHSDLVTGISRRNEHEFVSTSRDRTTRFWSMSTSPERNDRKRIRTDLVRICEVTRKSELYYLTISRDGALQMWGRDGLACVEEFSLFDEDVIENEIEVWEDVAVSHSGLVYALFRGHLFLVDIGSGKVVRIRKNVTCFSLTPDLKQLYIGTESREVFALNELTKEFKMLFKTDKIPISLNAERVDDKVCIGFEFGDIRLYDIKKGEIECEFESKEEMPFRIENISSGAKIIVVEDSYISTGCMQCFVNGESDATWSISFKELILDAVVFKESIYCILESGCLHEINSSSGKFKKIEHKSFFPSSSLWVRNGTVLLGGSDGILRRISLAKEKGNGPEQDKGSRCR